jgi:hypothetical protein
MNDLKVTRDHRGLVLELLAAETNILVAFNTLEHDPANPDTNRDLLIEN